MERAERGGRRSDEELKRSRKRRSSGHSYSRSKHTRSRVKSRSKLSRNHRHRCESSSSSVDSDRSSSVAVASGRSHTPSKSKRKKTSRSESSRKKKKRRHDSSDSDSSSDSASSSSSSERSPTPSKHRKKKHNIKDLKRKSKHVRHKRKKAVRHEGVCAGPVQHGAKSSGMTSKEGKGREVGSKTKKQVAEPLTSKQREGPSMDLKAAQTAKVRGPMTREEFEKQQSIVRRVYDPDTGRHRLVKGDGEIIEEIVSRDRQKAINKQATMGDGLSFQAQMKKLL